MARAANALAVVGADVRAVVESRSTALPLAVRVVTRAVPSRSLGPVEVGAGDPGVVERRALGLVLLVLLLLRASSSTRYPRREDPLWTAVVTMETASTI